MTTAPAVAEAARLSAGEPQRNPNGTPTGTPTEPTETNGTSTEPQRNPNGTPTEPQRNPNGTSTEPNGTPTETNGNQRKPTETNGNQRKPTETNGPKLWRVPLRSATFRYVPLRSGQGNAQKLTRRCETTSIHVHKDGIGHGDRRIVGPSRPHHGPQVQPFPERGHHQMRISRQQHVDRTAGT